MAVDHVVFSSTERASSIDGAFYTLEAPWGQH